jgi:hypothetical protein
MLGQVRLEVQPVRFFLFLHTAYTIDGSTLTNILPSLSFIRMIYCTAGTKATPASVHGLGVDF